MNPRNHQRLSLRRLGRSLSAACSFAFALLFIGGSLVQAQNPQPQPLPQRPTGSQQMQRPTVTLPVQRTTIAPKVTPAPVVKTWVLRNDAQPPTIAPGSEILLFIHGMDSRAEEADDITKALFSSITTTARTALPPVYPPIAANRTMVPFTASETCDHPDSYSNGQRTAVVPFDVVNGAQTRIYFEPI